MSTHTPQPVSPLISNPIQMHNALIRSCPHIFAEWASNGEWKAARHLKLIGKEIALAIAAGHGRLIVNLPPRHGKSYLCSKWTPIWFLDNWPHKKVIMTSYGDDHAQTWGRAVRDEFESNPKLITKLREDVKSVGTFYTQQGGMMISAGVGGKILGKGMDLGLIDDPFKNFSDVHSPVVRQGIVDWFESTFYTRREPGATIVIIMHRWHPDDLVGYLTKHHGDAWKVIRLPALAEAGDPLGRKVGEALWPERIPAEEFKSVRALEFQAMYQQNPPAEAAGRAYHNYTQADHLDGSIGLTPDRPLIFSMDFNVRPGSHAVVGQYDTYRDVFTWRHELHGPRWKTGYLMARFFEWVFGSPTSAYPITENVQAPGLGGWHFPVLHIYGDAAGRSESTKTTKTDYSVIEEAIAEACRVHNVHIPYRLFVPSKNPPVKDRMDTVNEALKDTAGEVHVKIHPECRRLVVDMENQPTDDEGLPDKSNPDLGHAADAMGYPTYWLRPVRRMSFGVQTQVY